MCWPCCDRSNNTRAFTTCITACEPSLFITRFRVTSQQLPFSPKALETWYSSLKTDFRFSTVRVPELVLCASTYLLPCEQRSLISPRRKYFSPATSNKKNPSFKTASKLEVALTSSEVSKLILSSRYVEKLVVSIGRIEKLRFSIKQRHLFSLQKHVISDLSK